MDINADGYDDIIVGGHDGIAQVVYGSREGFKEAENILDRDGGRVTLSKYYEWNEVEGEKTGWRYRYDGPKTHCTSVNAVDWDADGDLDLLLGDSAKGGLYVRINEGSAEAHQFATKNIAVLAGDEPVSIESCVSDSVLVDWNQDGRFDIILGGVGGGIYLLENTGDAKTPKFSAVVTLVKPADERAVKGARSSRKRLAFVETVNNLPAEPGSGIYLEATDYDNDGKLDLLVGARCTWENDEVEELTTAEKEDVVRLNAKFERLSKQIDEAYAEIKTTENSSTKQELSKKAQRLTLEMRVVDRKRRNLTAKKKRKRHDDFIWLLRGK